MEFLIRNRFSPELLPCFAGCVSFAFIIIISVALAGRRLQGEVSVKITSPVESAAPIKLIISGKEKSGMKVKTRGRTRIVEADRRFFSVTIPLRSFQGNVRVKPGVYTFPFSVKLPR